MAITLKALRVNKNLKVEEAAKLLGVTSRTLYSWESGKTFPDVRQITKIEELYNTSYNDINFLVSDIGLTEEV